MTDFQDTKELRNAMGTFATGITVVTTLDGQNEPVGMTVNSFSSVSLDPPLVLWCLAETSNYCDIFLNADYFAINILSADQQPLSQLFASPEENKFSQTDWHAGVQKMPLFPGCIAHMECRIEHRHAGGDHIILVGLVLNFKHTDAAPLVFSRGDYHSLTES